MFKIITVDNYDEMSKEGFCVLKEVIKNNPECVLGLATGSTPVGLYQLMIEDHQKNGTSYAKAQSFNLDEYVGLDRSHPESYYSFMHRNLFDHIDLKEENIHIPSDGADKKAQCKKYDDEMSKAVVDIQVLGIGSDGHIGFNEPGTPFDSLTHIVDLTSQTIADNARFFDNDINKVPTQAITMGIASIMKAKQILIMASGANKAEAVKAMIKGPVSTDCPASILQKHANVVVIIDKLAAKDI